MLTLCALTVLVHTSVQAQTCGDGVVQVELGESCDDGGEEQGDGCSATCRLERCGDVNGDDAINHADVATFRLALADPLASPLSLAGERKCGLILDPQNEPRPCDLLDVVVLRRSLRIPPLPPGIDPVCAVGDACAEGCAGGSETECNDLRILRTDPICVPQDGEARCEAQIRVLQVCTARSPTCEGEVFTTWRPTCRGSTETCGESILSGMNCLLEARSSCNGPILRAELCTCELSAAGGCECTSHAANCVAGGTYCITSRVLRAVIPGGSCIFGGCTSTIDVHCANGCDPATGMCL